MNPIQNINRNLRQALKLREYLSQRITLEQAEQIVRARIENRQAAILNLIHTAVFENTRSPYLKLLKAAGIEQGEIASLVGQEGVEGTLARLKSSGVYLSWEEFKGKKDITRGSFSFKLEEQDLDNPNTSSQFWSRTAGTQSAGTRSKFDLNHQLITSCYRVLMLAANESLETPVGMWQPMLPSIAGISPLMHYWTIRRPIVKWFSPMTEGQIRAPFQSRAAMRFIVYGGRIFGARLANPEYVPFTEAASVARWLGNMRVKHGSCALESFVSTAVKVCQAAMDNNISLEGVRFFVGGEPLTEAKYRHIKAAGAGVTPRYFNTELGSLGYGCPEAHEIDEVHLFHDSLAVIQQSRELPQYGTTVNSLLLTGLLPTVPKIMINVECGDQAVMETRDCSCLFGRLGFNTVLHHIRSFEKLTSGGMTILSSDLIHVLEEVLPAKYGGSPADYQLVEEEDENGGTRLVLIVSPQVNAFDEKNAIETLLSALRSSAYGGKLAAGFWSQLSTLKISRSQPISAYGKISPLRPSKT